MGLDSDLKKQGYNKEEAYFHVLNKALIEKSKERDLSDADKKGRKKEQGRCPQCDAVLEVIQASGLSAGRSGNCLGIFLSKEALELLLEIKEPRKFLNALWRAKEEIH